jgi:poly-gamma-glutamate synthesis protein (capsule biosynthesis protein)
MKKILVFFLVCVVAIALFIATGLAYKNYYLKSGNQAVKKVPVAQNIVTVKATAVVPEKTTTFTFAGDMMFDRYINHEFKNIGFDHIFDNLDKSLFSSQDIRFANLEGPVSAVPIVDDNPARTLVFDMPPETIQTLKNLGINGVSLGNNHSSNAGASGFKTTQNLLAAAGIKYAGSQDDFDQSNIVEFDTEIPISIICVDYLSFQKNTVIDAAIKTEKAKNYFVILFPHWGVEYALTHNQSQENAADNWIDNGADLVIGSHPHVVEDIDIYKSKPIIYSLGNFVFDQAFSADTQQGLILSGKITDKNLELTFDPIQSINLKPQLASLSVANQMLGRILNLSKFSSIPTNGNSINIER